MKTKHRKRVIFIQALLALLWSLYYSNFWDPIPDLINWTLFVWPWLTPCNLCRWARICMYPIILLSFLSIIYKEDVIRKYILPLASIWIIINTFHYILQKFPIQTSQICTFDKPCDALTVDYFWFLTIPLLCWIAFAVIIVGCIFWRRSLTK